LSGPAAGGQVKRARLLAGLPALAGAAAAGAVSSGHVDQVVRLAERVGVAHAAAAEPALVAVGSVDVPQRLRSVCARVLVHVDPDGGQPDAQVDFARRALALSPCDGMVLVRGQLDPEGGAALATALDALMRPPGCGDARSATQRRAGRPRPAQPRPRWPISTRRCRRSWNGSAPSRRCLRRPLRPARVSRSRVPTSSPQTSAGR